MTPFTLKALLLLAEVKFKGSFVDNSTIHRKDILTYTNPHIKWEKKFLCIQTCPVVRKNSTVNLAYILAQNTSYELPTITTVVKLESCPTGIDHMVFY